MSPMSIGKRRFYFLVFFVLFLLFIPVLLLYTSGYRLGDNLTLVKTGGIYISVPVSDADIYVNNELKKTTGLLQKSFFEQNMGPGTYFVFVFKEGYWPWSKELKVHEQIVSDAYPFLIPREPKLEEITKLLINDDGTVSKTPNPAWNDVTAIFSIKKATTSPLAKLTTESGAATTTVTRDKVRLTREGDDIYAEWLGSQNDAPAAFCDEYKKECAMKIGVFSSPTKIKTFDFYPGRNDVVIISRKNGIYAVETDKRKIQNFALVYAGGDPDFRIGSDGKFYVKDGDSIFLLTL